MNTYIYSFVGAWIKNDQFINSLLAKYRQGKRYSRNGKNYDL